MGVDEKAFLAALPQQALNAFDDQCAPANPRMPMLDDMRELMLAAYYGAAPAADTTPRPAPPQGRSAPVTARPSGGE